MDTTLLPVLIQAVVLALVVWAVYSYVKSKRKTPRIPSISSMVCCTQCGYMGPPKRVTPGSIWIEVVLLFFMVVPAVIYSIWRVANRYEACARCGQRTIIPADSPRAQTSILRDERDCPWCSERILATAKVCKHCHRDVVALVE